MLPAELAALLTARPPSAGATRVLAVDGPSGSGKTDLAAAVSDVLGGAPVVHMDDLYPGWDGLADAVPRLVAEVLEPLSRGDAARYRRYDWGSGRYAEWHEVDPAPTGDVLVVEGVGSGALACAPYLALLAWVEARPEVRFARAMARDGGTYLPYWHRWAAQEDQHFPANRTRDRADVRISTDPC